MPATRFPERPRLRPGFELVEGHSGYGEKEEVDGTLLGRICSLSLWHVVALLGVFLGSFYLDKVTNRFRLPLGRDKFKGRGRLGFRLLESHDGNR